MEITQSAVWSCFHGAMNAFWRAAQPERTASSYILKKIPYFAAYHGACVYKAALGQF